MIPLSIAEIISSTPCKEFNLDKNRNKNISEFIYDSRQASLNCAFLCIPGAKVDGHDFIESVCQKKPTLIIGSDLKKISDAAKKFEDCIFLHVDSSLDALTNIATAYRKKLSLPVTAITGSSGKTTTKDLCKSILSQSLITEGTLNNHWGVPQTVLKIRENHKSAILEMGISGFKELEHLSKIGQPDHAYITTIGAAHLENLKSLDGVLTAKREVFDWIRVNKKSGSLIFNIDNTHLNNLYEEFKAFGLPKLKLISISLKNKNADCYAKTMEMTVGEHDFGWNYEFSTPWGNIKGHLPLPGEHNLQNGLAAAAITLNSGVVSISDVQEGLAHPKITKLRTEIFKISPLITIYNDSYNANPTSVEALFKTVHSIQCSANSPFQESIAVVGDMLELGPSSSEIHQSMGHQARKLGINGLLSTGTFKEDWTTGFNKADSKNHFLFANTFPNHQALADFIKNNVLKTKKPTMILVKGSRGAKMDIIVDLLKTMS